MKTKIISTGLALGLAMSGSVALAEGTLNIYNWGNYTSPN